MDVGGVVVAAVGAEGEFQACLLRSHDECFVGDMGYFVYFDGQLFRFCHFDDVVYSLRRPELCILACDWDRQERGPSEDVDGLGGHQLFDELRVAVHESFGVVDHGVDLPDGKPGAVGVGEREGVHEDVVELVEEWLGERFRPSRVDGLHADVDGIFAEAVDVVLEIGVRLEGEAFAGMFDYADVDSTFFAQLESLIDREGVA